MGVRICPSCKGGRLSQEALSVRIEGININDVTKMSIRDAQE